MQANKVTLVKTLSTLHTALAAPRDEFEAFASAVANPVTDKMNEILKRRRDEAQNEATEKAATEILDLVQESDSMINSHRIALSDARRQVAINTKLIENIAVARRYGEKTMNWIPLAVALGKVTLSTAIDSASIGTLVAVPDAEAKALLSEIKAEQAIIQEKKAAANKPVVFPDEKTGHDVKQTPTGKAVPIKRVRKVATAK